MGTSAVSGYLRRRGRCDILASENRRPNVGLSLLSPEPFENRGRAGGRFLTFPDSWLPGPAPPAASAADCTLTIAVKPVELAPKHIVSTTTYNGQFPGPLLRFKEGQPVTIDIHNQTDTPEQLHWHGQFLSTDVDGMALFEYV